MQAVTKLQIITTGKNIKKKRWQLFAVLSVIAQMQIVSSIEFTAWATIGFNTAQWYTEPLLITSSASSLYLVNATHAASEAITLP